MTLKNGAMTYVDTAPMTKVEADRFLSSYVGSRHRLLVYETAEFAGTPDGLPDDLGYLHSNRRFGFEPYLVVLAER